MLVPKSLKSYHASPISRSSNFTLFYLILDSVTDEPAACTCTKIQNMYRPRLGVVKSPSKGRPTSSRKAVVGPSWALLASRPKRGNYMGRLLKHNLFFCGYSGWVGWGYLNFLCTKFLPLLMIPFFSCNVLRRPRRLHIIDLPISSTHPTKFSCYNRAICSSLKTENQAAQAPSMMSLLSIAGQCLRLLNYTVPAADGMKDDLPPW